MKRLLLYTTTDCGGSSERLATSNPPSYRVIFLPDTNPNCSATSVLFEYDDRIMNRSCLWQWSVIITKIYISTNATRAMLGILRDLIMLTNTPSSHRP